MKFASCVVFAICLGAAAAEVYFEEDFSGEATKQDVALSTDLSVAIQATGSPGGSCPRTRMTSASSMSPPVSTATHLTSVSDAARR